MSSGTAVARDIHGFDAEPDVAQDAPSRPVTLSLKGRAVRIYYSAGSDPMVLDSIAGLNAILRRLIEFLDSDQSLIRLFADMSGSAEPHDELLPALEVEKTDDSIFVSLSTASAENQRWGREPRGLCELLSLPR